MLLPIAFLSLLLMPQNQAPAVPAIVSDPDFPLRVQLAQTGSGMSNGRTNAWGHGNVLGPPVEGFDFTAECNQHFAFRPEGNQYFRARWKKQGLRLEILIQEIGSQRITACELKVAMQEQAYDLNPTGVGMGMAMMNSPRPAVPVTVPDLNFPLQVQIWVRSSGWTSQGAHSEGYGNILGETPTGFDFGNTCPVRLATGGRPETFQARWVEQGFRMEILVQEVGTRQQSVCQLDVGLKTAPYPAPTPGVRVVPPPKTPSPEAPKSTSGDPL